MTDKKKILAKLFLSTLYLSAFTFGGGYVIVTLMKQKFVGELHWIQEDEMLDLIAIAQSAPGAIAVNGAIVVGFKLAGQKADDGHPFGHGRLEYLTGLLVSLVILLVGLELAKSSVEKIIHPEPVEFSWLSAGILVAALGRTGALSSMRTALER